MDTRQELEKLYEEHKQQHYSPPDLIDPAISQWIFENQDFRCHYCGVMMILPPWPGPGSPAMVEMARKAGITPYTKKWMKKLRAFRATIDHIYPKSRGGGNEIENLVGACQACNTYKAAEPYHIAIDIIQERIRTGTHLCHLPD